MSIVLGGEAGQGIKTVEGMVVRALKLSGYHVYATEEYMSRVRGGINITEIMVSSRRIRSFSSRIDILIPFHKGVVSWVRDRISRNTVVIGDSKDTEEDKFGEMMAVRIPLIDIAKKAGSALYLNTVVAGLILGLFEGNVDILKEHVSRRFMSKGSSVVNGNLTALDKGYELGKELRGKGVVPEMERDMAIANEIILGGTEAVALGAFSGGMNFLSFYPMSPATGVAVFSAKYSEELDILVEQTEDEIAAVNMAIGAWYAGSRAMVTTSGGGFSLMCEAISLAGMAEIPLVIHLAQRPGPATGLPTRTMQGDLDMALHAGHGEFPRIILAPGSIEQAFHLTAEAFDIAERFQTPVIILTDQYLMDIYYNVSDIDVKKVNVKRYIMRTKKDYRRYILTKDGISPRAIPGNGKGVVVANGNEHDEWGDISEDEEMSRKMQEKRAIRKMDTVRKHARMPEMIGNRKSDTVVISWGSTYHAVKEAIERLESDILFMHFSWIHPLPTDIREILDGKTLISVEQNVSGQFARLLSSETGIDVGQKVLKYSGRPFSAEEIHDVLKTITEGEDGR